jgi:hypothetical protein
LEGFFRTNNGFFGHLMTFIQGSKQKRKKTHNAENFPAEQRVSDQTANTELTTLLHVAMSEMPDLTPKVYEHVKNAFGKRCKCLRVFVHSLSARRPLAMLPNGSSPPNVPDYLVEKPLHWTNVVNGGQQYVYLRSEEDLIRRAWNETVFGTTRRRPKSCAEMAREKLEAPKAAQLPLGEWTSDVATLHTVDVFSGCKNE